MTRTARPTTVFRVPRASTVDLIAIELRTAIYSGTLPVGHPIGEAEISSQLGVSRGPLREATQRLVQEGLLTATPGRGLRVAMIGPDQVVDLYDARMAIEGEALRIILRDATHEVAASQLEQALEAFIDASAHSDARTIGNADLDFHRRLVEASASRRLTRTMATLAIETRIASLSTSDGYTVRRDVPRSYRMLIESLRGADADSAIAALREQFDEASARLRGELPEHVVIDTVQVPHPEQPSTLGPLFGANDAE